MGVRLSTSYSRLAGTNSHIGLTTVVAVGRRQIRDLERLPSGRTASQSTVGVTLGTAVGSIAVALDIDQIAMEIVEKSLEWGDKGPITSVEGECIECSDIAVCELPIMGEKYCGYHAREYFTERHG